MATKKARTGAGGTPDQADAVDLTPHPLVNQNHPDPDDITPAPPEVIYLVGYIGASKRPDYTRLYQDLSFRNYYEIPTSGIVSTTPVNPDDENSPTHLQVLADTKLDVITVSVQSVEARFLSGSISSGFFGAAATGTGAQAAAAQMACTNITTYMPSCVAQQAGAQAVGAQLACTNITTYMPSCVAQQRCDPNCVATIVTSHVDPPVCITRFTAIPSNCAPQNCITRYTAIPSGCDPQCQPIANTAATLCTQKTAPDPRTIICPTVYTANPSNCAPQCNPYCAATVVTSHIGAPLDALGAAAAAQPVCITLHTANPSNCAPLCTNITTHMPSCVGQPVCLTVVTANPTDCGLLCGNIRTYMPSCLKQPQVCIDLYTANPSHCAPDVRPTPCTQFTLLAAGAQGDPITTCVPYYSMARSPELAAGAQAAAPGYCITVYTHAPTYCPPPCRPIANTAATLCTQIHANPYGALGGGAGLACGCATNIQDTNGVFAAAQCQPIANTAATLCTQRL